MIGYFLRLLSFQSFLELGIFVSAIVVTRNDGQPGQGFTELMLATGKQINASDDVAITSWATEVQKVHDKYNE